MIKIITVLLLLQFVLASCCCPCGKKGQGVSPQTQQTQEEKPAK